MQDEASEIERNARRYYRYDAQVLPEKTESFQAELDSFLQEINRVNPGESAWRQPMRSQLLQKIPEMLGRYYDQGIIQNNTADTRSDDLLIESRQDLLMEKEYRDYLRKEDVLNAIALELYGSSTWKDQELRLFFERFLTPNVFFDAQRTQRASRQAIGDISSSRGMISKGELIIHKNEPITPDKYQILVSLREEYDARLGALKISRFWLITGQTVMVTLLLGMLLTFLILLRRDLFDDVIKLTLLLGLVTATVLIAAFVNGQQWLNLSIYVLPFCILPIIIARFSIPDWPFLRTW